MINHRVVFPSSLVQHRDDSEHNLLSKISNDTTLKLGVVLEVIEANSKDNQTKQGPEYHVMVIEQHKTKGINSAIYKNCVALDSFGGAADYLQFTRRAPTDRKKVKDKATMKSQNGSIVLLLCLDGSSETGIIVGALPHPAKSKVLTPDKQTHLEGEFNGLNWEINKDGELTITFKSATNNDGKPQDEQAGGSNIKIEKDGSVELSDGNEESIRIDKTAKTVTTTAESDIINNTQANYQVTAEENIELTSTLDLIFKASGSALLKSTKAMDIESSANLNIKAKGMTVNGGSSLNVKASNIAIKAPKVSIGPAPAPAIVLTTTFQGVGNLGIPVISFAVGPFSSSVSISL